MYTIEEERLMALELFDESEINELKVLNLPLKAERILIKSGHTRLDDVLTMNYDSLVAIPYMSSFLAKETFNRITLYKIENSYDDYDCYSEWED